MISFDSILSVSGPIFIALVVYFFCLFLTFPFPSPKRRLTLALKLGIISSFIVLVSSLHMLSAIFQNGESNLKICPTFYGSFLGD